MGAPRTTPGPWSLDQFTDYVDGTDMEVLDADNFPIASVEARPLVNRWPERFPEMSHWSEGVDSRKTLRPRKQSELLANAHQIAASGALYDALKWFIDDIDSTHTVMLDFDANVERARAALALARGETA